MGEKVDRGSRSPLNLVVLALLFEEPMHPYRMQKLIEERGKDEVVNIRSRNSIQQTVTRLERDGLIAASGTERHGGYPQRTVYELTADGRERLMHSLHDLLSTPAREFPAFPAALSFMAILPVATAVDLLRRRRERLADAVARTTESTRAAAHIPPILLIENDYAAAMQRAEIDWIDRVVDAIRGGDLTWDPQRLIGESHLYEA